MALLSFSHLIVPPEICGIIVELTQSLGQSHLSNLCRVSRAFHAEGHHRLYREVTLFGIEPAESWARMVQERPQLSAKTKRLVIHLPRDADDVECVVEGLRTCVALEDLQIFEELDNRYPDGKRETYADNYGISEWIIEDPPFKLKSFTNQYFHNHLLDKFLISHPYIQSLTVKGDEDLYGDYREAPLANVRTLDAMSYHVAGVLLSDPDFGRRLQHMQNEITKYYKITDSEELFSLFESCKTLQSLSIVSTDRDRYDLLLRLGWPFHSYTSLVSEHLAKIRYLRVLSKAVDVQAFDVAQVSSLSWEHIISTAFHQLEVLVLHPPVLEGECVYEVFRTPSARRHVARSVMDAMSSLKRLEFGIGSELHRFLKSKNGIQESWAPSEEGHDRRGFN